MKTNDLNAICENDTCATEWPLDMCGYQCDCGSYIWAKGDTDDTDALPEVDAEDLISHSGRQWAFGVPGTYQGCKACGEPERTRICEQCGKSALVIDCGHHDQPAEIAWCHETRRDLCEECSDDTDPGSLPEVDAEDVSSSINEYFRSACILIAEQNDEIETLREELSRAREEIQMAHDANLSLVAQLESLPPASPPTPARGEAKDGEDGDAVKAASDLMADLARENMHLTAEAEKLRAENASLKTHLRFGLSFSAWRESRK